MRLLAEIALVVVAAAGAVLCVALVPAVKWPAARRPAPRRTTPEQLAKLERLVSSAEASSLQAHAYLRPLLAEIVARRLAARGRRLESMPPERARALLGDGLWELVRPGRPFPVDRHAPGVSQPELEAMLDRLEAL